MYDTKIEDILEAQRGNKDVLQKIIETNIGLVWNIVKRFKGRGYDIEDLYQIGCMGFIKAIKRFNSEFDVKISTYAIPYILGEIKRFIRDDGLIKVSRSIKELSTKINEMKNYYYNKKGEELTIEKICKLLKVSKEEVFLAMESRNQVESINEETYKENDNKETKLNRIIMVENEETKIVDKIFLQEMINSLEGREKKIVILRYYKEKTQMQVAKMLGITQVQVSRIEKKILEKMKNKMIS